MITKKWHFCFVFFPLRFDVMSYSLPHLLPEKGRNRGSFCHFEVIYETLDYHFGVVNYVISVMKVNLKLSP